MMMMTAATMNTTTIHASNVNAQILSNEDSLKLKPPAALDLSACPLTFCIAIQELFGSAKTETIDIQIKQLPSSIIYTLLPEPTAKLLI
jgi:hypothetical protein